MDDRRIDESDRSYESSAGVTSRRDALKLFGAGATIAGLSTTALGGVVAGRTQQAATDVDDYEFTVGSSTALTNGETTVRQIGDELVVSGSLVVGSSSCKTIGLADLGYDDSTGQLSVTLLDIPVRDPETGEEPTVCTTDYVAKSYELRVPFESPPASVVVVESDLEATRRLTFDGDGVPVVIGVDDYELTLTMGSLGDAEIDPTVRFGDDEVVVEGTIVIGSSSCKTAAPALIEYDEGAGVLAVDMTDVRAPDPTSDDVVRDCTDDHAAAAYQLAIPFEELPEVVIATESDLEGERRVTEHRNFDDLPPIDGVQPQDLNDDGRYEDVNGNGTADFDDVVTFFEHMDEPTVQDYVAAYDFNGNGRIDFDDVVALFEAV